MNNQVRAETMVEWLLGLKYGDEDILHAVMHCDFLSRQNLVRNLMALLDYLENNQPPDTCKPLHEKDNLLFYSRFGDRNQRYHACRAAYKMMTDYGDDMDVPEWLKVSLQNMKDLMIEDREDLRENIAKYKKFEDPMAVRNVNRLNKMLELIS